MLDEEALADGLREDPDATLALLADLAGATDRELRELARRLAKEFFNYTFDENSASAPKVEALCSYEED